MSDATQPSSQSALSRSDTAALARQQAISRGIELLSPSTLVSVIEPLALAIEHHAGRDPDRVLRIRHYAAALAESQKLSKREIVAIELAALLGSVGQFPPPCPFWLIGAEILSVAPPLEAAAPIVRHQFQRWDGTGFPSGLKGSAGLKGSDIPLGARILAVAEYYVRLTQGGNKLNVDEACGGLRHRSGKLFDPALVLDFCRIAEDVTKSFRIPEGLAAVLKTLDWARQLATERNLDWADWADEPEEGLDQDISEAQDSVYTPHILVVDDEPSMRAMLRIVLHRDGYKVLLAENGEQALECLRLHRVDVLLCDIRMPDLSGMEVLRTAKTINRDIVALMMTAFASTDTAVEAMRLGAVDYFVKPFSMDELRLNMRQHLHRVRGLNAASTSTG